MVSQGILLGQERRRGDASRGGRRGEFTITSAHHDEVIHGLLRYLRRHVGSFRNYRLKGSSGIDTVIPMRLS